MKVESKETKVQYSTRLKPSVIKKLKKQANTDKVSAALVIEALVEKYIR